MNEKNILSYYFTIVRVIFDHNIIINNIHFKKKEETIVFMILKGTLYFILFISIYIVFCVFLSIPII